jgi:RimJ/RimL family protein N-acetyltransferase
MILRGATAGDIAFVMCTERTPGYEQFISQWDAAKHAAEIADPATRYLVAERDAAPVAFAILQNLDDPNGGVYLQRFAAAEQGRGDGAWLLRAVQDWVFARPTAHRLHLHFSVENERGRRLYDRAGFQVEGIERDVYKMPDGRRVSRYLVSILRPEWEKLRGM